MSGATEDSMTQPTQDAHANLQALAGDLRRAALEVIWRQWRAVGGQAATETPARAIVDPEALVLLSLTLMDDELRLSDLIHDWAVRNSDLLSVQRAKNLAADYPDTTRGRLAWFARLTFQAGKDSRWRSLVAPGMNTSVTLDESAPMRTNKARALRTRLADPAALMLRLRLGFGVGTKADVLAFLLGIEGRWSTIREITIATKYTVTAVRRAAEDMAAARLVHVSLGPPAAYRADREAWSGVLGLDEELPLWRDWHERFAFIAAFLAWVETTPTQRMSAYALGVKGHELLERHRRPFERDLMATWSKHVPVVDRAAFMARAVRALTELMVKDA